MGNLYYLTPLVAIGLFYFIYFASKNPVLKKMLYVFLGLGLAGVGYFVFNLFYGGSKLKNVCEGVAYEGASAYTPEVAGLHPTALFIKEGDQSYKSVDLVLSYMDTKEWEAPIWNKSKTEIVACVVLTPIKKGEKCDYYYRGGNTKTDASETFSAKFEISLLEAKTAKKLAQTSFTLGAPSCPSTKRSSDPDKVYPSYFSGLVKLAKPFVEKK